MARRAGLAVIVVAVATGCAGAAAPIASQTLPPAAITIEAHGGRGVDLTFAPATLRDHAGDIVRVVDIGTMEHDLTIDVGGGVPKSKAQQDISVQIHVDLVNTTSMVGTLTVH